MLSRQRRCVHVWIGECVATNRPGGSAQDFIAPTSTRIIAPHTCNLFIPHFVIFYSIWHHHPIVDIVNIVHTAYLLLWVKLFKYLFEYFQREEPKLFPMEVPVLCNVPLTLLNARTYLVVSAAHFAGGTKEKVYHRVKEKRVIIRQNYQVIRGPSYHPQVVFRYLLSGIIQDPVPYCRSYRADVYFIGCNSLVSSVQFIRTQHTAFRMLQVRVNDWRVLQLLIPIHHCHGEFPVITSHDIISHCIT